MPKAPTSHNGTLDSAASAGLFFRSKFPDSALTTASAVPVGIPVKAEEEAGLTVLAY
jgi:hypothetical protein